MEKFDEFLKLQFFLRVPQSPSKLAKVVLIGVVNNGVPENRKNTKSLLLLSNPLRITVEFYRLKNSSKFISLHDGGAIPHIQ